MQIQCSGIPFLLCREQAYGLSKRRRCQLLRSLWRRPRQSTHQTRKPRRTPEHPCCILYDGTEPAVLRCRSVGLLPVGGRPLLALPIVILGASGCLSTPPARQPAAVGMIATTPLKLEGVRVYPDRLQASGTLL